MIRLRFLAAAGVLLSALGGAALLSAPAFARQQLSVPRSVVAAVTPTARITPTTTATARSEITSSTTANASATPTLTVPLSVTAPATLTTPVTAAGTSSITATNSITLSQAITAQTGPPAISGVAPDTAALDELQGTIVANLTSLPAKFFVGGAVYTVPPRLSTGLVLPRPTEMLMLYTCSADTTGQSGGCYWDAYLLQQGGLYEVRPTASNVAGSGLLLAAAEPPPNTEVWVQNRTGHTESVIFADQVYDLSPAVVQEFGVSPDTPAVLYVRSCVNQNDQSVCEWAPKSLDAGVFYAMQETSAAGVEPGSTATAIDLLPILMGGAVTQATQAEVTCTLQVPAVNIRSGPGLQYEIVGKVRSTAQAPATLGVTGRSADSLWYTVSDAVVPGGWVTSSSNFIACSGDVAALPEVEFSTPAVAESTRPLPAATPVVTPAVAIPAEEIIEAEVTPIPEDTGVGPEVVAEDTPAPEGESTGPAIPPGQALLVVNNGFMYDMRFTIDQLYRPQEGPSEYDLAPGESVAIVVFPGQVAFTASSPWNGLSGNADIYVDADQAVPLWLRFEVDEGDSGSWRLAWQ